MERLSSYLRDAVPLDSFLQFGYSKPISIYPDIVTVIYLVISNFWGVSKFGSLNQKPKKLDECWSKQLMNDSLNLIYRSYYHSATLLNSSESDQSNWSKLRQTQECPFSIMLRFFPLFTLCAILIHQCFISRLNNSHYSINLK